MAALDFALIPSQEQTVARILQLTDLSPSVIFLDGAESSGKTTISQLLMTEMASKFRLGVVSVQKEMSSDKVRELIIKELAPHAVFDATDPMVETLSRTLQSVSGNGLLIIDGLSENTYPCLRELWDWLIYLDHAQPSHKQSVLLLGEKNSNLESSCFSHFKNRANPLIEMEVETLTLKEQKKLLLHSLNGVNLTAENKQEISDALSSCDGNPGKIIALAEHYMNDSSSSKSEKSPIKIHRGAALVAVFAGLALILSWLIPSLTKKESTQANSNTQAARQEVVVQTQSDATVVSSTSSTSTTSTNVIAQDGVTSQAETSQPVTADTPQDDAKNRVVISDQAIQQMNQNATPSNTASPSAVAETASQQPQGSHTVTSVQQLQPIVEHIKGDEPKTIAEPSRDVITKDDHPVSAEKPKKKAIEKPKKMVEKTVNKKVVAKHEQPKPALKQKPAVSVAKSNGGFGLQLSASANEAALKTLSTSIGVSGKARVLKNSQNNMYVLVYGNYASAAQAKADVARLPAKAQALKPWPKSYSQLKN